MMNNLMRSLDPSMLAVVVATQVTPSHSSPTRHAERGGGREGEMIMHVLYECIR
jgi:hypothetical protein